MNTRIMSEQCQIELYDMCLMYVSMCEHETHTYVTAVHILCMPEWLQTQDYAWTNGCMPGEYSLFHVS